MSGLVRSLAALALSAALSLPAAAQTRDPMDHFFNPLLGDFRAELTEAKAEFMLLADFVASGSYRTMQFTQYRQSMHAKKGT